MICVVPREDQRIILNRGSMSAAGVHFFLQTLCDDFNQQNAELCANLLQPGCPLDPLAASAASGVNPLGCYKLETW